MKEKYMKALCLTGAVWSCLSVSSLFASELVYNPINPSFGGNPLNGNHLLSTAQAQNKHKSGESRSRIQRSSLDRFNDSLQFRLLNQLLADIGNGGSSEGVLNTQDFIVNINDGDDGLTIETIDKSTGETTSIVVDGLRAD